MHSPWIEELLSLKHKSIWKEVDKQIFDVFVPLLFILFFGNDCGLAIHLARLLYLLISTIVA